MKGSVDIRFMKDSGWWSYYAPTKVTFGRNCLSRIVHFVEIINPKRIMLITGKKSMKSLGVTGKIVDWLKDYKVIIYDKVERNPTVKLVEDGIGLLTTEACDLVIGLGGGSVIDVAKTIAILARNLGPVDEYLAEERRIRNKGLSLIVIPTTAGTGSEVTKYASIIDERKRLKRSLSHEYIIPDVAIVDSSLTATMPKFVTATTGLDALTQCIEAYWSIHHTPISDVFALKGIELISKNLTDAFNFPRNLEFREKMALASLFSGLAINITKTTIVHSVSYPLTAHFGVTHGLACSLTLPSFIKFNSEVVKKRIFNIAATMGVENTEQCIKKVEELIANVELPDKLEDVGVEGTDIELIIREGFRPDRAGNNPRAVTEEDLRQILLDIR